MDFADDFATGSDAIRQALRLSKPDFRMRDVELLVRFFTFTEFLPFYDGNLKRSLDRTCEALNEAWRADEAQIVADAETCNLAIDTTLEIFGPWAFRRFSDNKWESRFNRAVFDAMVFYFRDAAVSARARAQSTAVVDAYQRVSGVEEFQQALVTTTKSLGATRTRLALWGEALAKALSMKLPVVVLDDGRLAIS